MNVSIYAFTQNEVKELTMNKSCEMVVPITFRAKASTESVLAAA